MRSTGWLGGAAVAAGIAVLMIPGVSSARASSTASAGLTAHATAIAPYVWLTPPHATPDGPPWGP
jgi:hypothetical protein